MLTMGLLRFARNDNNDYCSHYEGLRTLRILNGEGYIQGMSQKLKLVETLLAKERLAKQKLSPTDEQW